jgi:Rrf2 family protein
MQLSKRCEYGLRALIDLGLAQACGIEVVSIRALAAHERISEEFLEQILAQLKDAGFVGSRRGKHGGYCLAKRPKDILPGDAVRLLDGPLAPIRCVSVNSYERCSCPDEGHCGLRMLMLDVRQAVGQVLERNTLADVVAITLRKLRRDRVRIPFLEPPAREHAAS